MKKQVFKIFLSASVIFCLSSCYDFNRDQMKKDAEAKGQSTLLEAESSKKALIEIAKAEAQAEIERAYGVAKANEIIGNSLRGNSEYLRYLQIDAIRNSKGDKIYIPTEAGLPIIEARK